MQQNAAYTCAEYTVANTTNACNQWIGQTRDNKLPVFRLAFIIKLYWRSSAAFNVTGCASLYIICMILCYPLYVLALPPNENEQRRHSTTMHVETGVLCRVGEHTEKTWQQPSTKSYRDNSPSFFSCTRSIKRYHEKSSHWLTDWHCSSALSTHHRKSVSLIKLRFKLKTLCQQYKPITRSSNFEFSAGNKFNFPCMAYAGCGCVWVSVCQHQLVHTRT